MANYSYRKKYINYSKKSSLITLIDNLINGSQHGFIKSKSCVTNLLSFYRKVYKAADRDDNYNIAYLNFSKKFDKLPHLWLLSELKAHGIQDKVLMWIREWLSDRKERVQVNRDKWDGVTVSSGVPQWSGLSPLLFFIIFTSMILILA